MTGSLETPVLTPEVLTSGYWSFGMASGDLFARNVVLSTCGRVLHYDSPNERAWRLENNCLLFLAEDGRVSARLSPLPASDGARLSLVGEHVLGGPSGLHLALTETGIQYPAYFKWSAAHEAIAARAPFFLSTPFRIEAVYRPGELLVIARPATVEPYATLPLGAFLTVGAYSYCHGSFPSGSATIGRYCSIAGDAKPFGPAHPLHRVSTALFSYDPYYSKIARDFGVYDYAVEPFDQDALPVIIENDVWIGEGAMLKGGITIGSGSVVAARAVVTKDVAPYSIVAGVPSRVVKLRFPARLVDELLESRWWTYNFCHLPRHFSDPSVFLEALRRQVGEGKLQLWAPEKIDLAEAFLKAVN